MFRWMCTHTVGVKNMSGLESASGGDGDCFAVLKEIFQAAMLCWTKCCFRTPILFLQHARQCVCGGVWAACGPRLPLELFLSGGGVRPSRPVTVGHSLQREEHQSPHLQHNHLWSAATNNIYTWSVICVFSLNVCVFSQKRKKRPCGAWRTMCHMCCLWQRGFSTVHYCCRHSSQGKSSAGVTTKQRC